ncbi:pyridoxal-phosphate dependent enzyme [Thalassoglobus polymorphus]|uniref:Threonine synthase n=1 Tax=Thalassoglobus polymorphus TaxID=2527994 RepID=A0A517QQF0_9PLAN|nr:pyridoxal-phosphate dependent enzyme [Thalassoglobus polymorphus]QDT33870.1 Threonine synthase [Thalassoglobus polymorphus]
MSIWRWADLIEPVPVEARITLGEGNTPLMRSRRIGPAAGLKNLFFKLETGNATGSYKDRFAFAGISHMVAKGKKKCIATSSGNTGAALAAYCAAAGIECRIAIVEGAPLGKLTQMMAYGAKIARIKKFGTDATTTTNVLEKLQRLGHRPDSALQVSAFVYSPTGMSGVQTMAFELAEQSPEGIDHVFCPAGGGGLCVAMARGFGQMAEKGKLEKLPAVECVQPEGNNTISGPLREGAKRAQPVACTTQVSGLQVASVVDGHLAVAECRATGGTGHLVADQFVWDVQKRLAREEGIFSEPAGSVALAGALKAAENGEIDKDAKIVCIVSGSGFKDSAAIDRINSDVDCPTVDISAIDEW